MTQNNSNNDLTTGMRWAARLIGLLALGLFVAFVIMSGPSVFASISLVSLQGLPLLIALLLALGGVLVAWRWELIGGIMTLVGSAAIIGLVCLGSGTDMFLCSMFFTLPLIVAGVLYLACSYRSREMIAA